MLPQCFPFFHIGNVVSSVSFCFQDANYAYATRQGTKIQACEQLQKFCLHKQVSRHLFFASNLSRGQISQALSNWMGPFDTPTIARYASEVITRTNSDKQNRMVEDLTLLQAHKQVFLKQFFKQKCGVQFLPISLRSVKLMLSDSPWVPIICILFLHFSCFIIYFSQNLTVLEIDTTFNK